MSDDENVPTNQPQDGIPPAPPSAPNVPQAQVPQATAPQPSNTPTGVTQTTINPTNTTKSFVPVVPKRGGVRLVDANTYGAWTGGRPTFDMTALEEPNPKQIGSSQYVGTTVYGRAKNRALKQQGQDTAFTRDGDLLIFQRTVWKHLKTYGMDTISYLPDPSVPKVGATNPSTTTVFGGTITVIDHHAMFHFDSAVADSNHYKTTVFDEYCLENDHDANGH